jgi:hypothetical protein
MSPAFLATRSGEDTEDKAILEFVSASVAVGWPIANARRAGRTRRRAAAAFDATLRDADFLKEASQQNIEINALSGAEIEQIVGRVLNAPQDIRDKARIAAGAQGL